MKVILTSKGFESEIVFDKIINKLDKNINEIKMLVIPIARKNIYIKEKYMEDYISLGFKKENVYFFDDENPKEYENLDIDVIYVCGGNTFTLKYYLKKSKFEKIIYEYLNKGVTYIGASAGTHIATNSIEHVLNFDENIIKETDMSGLNLYDGILICHYDLNRKKIYIELLKKYKKVDTLTDDEIIYLDNNKWIKE